MPALLGMPGRLVTVAYRGARVHVLAEHDRAAQEARAEAPRPVVDLLHLELLTGAGEAPGWPRPVALHAVVEARRDPVRAVRKASQWASYTSRVAVAPPQRVGDQAAIEAALLGVWLVASGPGCQCRVVAAGQRGPAPGSGRGLLHRLLDELIWAELDRSHVAVASGADV